MPHVSAGQHAHGNVRRAIKAKVKEAAVLLGLEGLLARRPAQLSGGERQRVAIGRAMLRQPQVFLMDEPLSSLDARLRLQMRAEIARLQRRLGTTTLYVTHDQQEAMTLGDRVAVLNRGVLEQVDTADALYHHPATLFVATFIGSPPMNVFDGVVEDGILSFANIRVPMKPVAAPNTGEIVVGVRPADLQDVRRLSSTDDLVVIEAVVEAVENLGSELHVVFALDKPHGNRGLSADGLYTACFDTGRHPRPGDRIRLACSPDDLYLFDPTTGRALSLL